MAIFDLSLLSGLGAILRILVEMHFGSLFWPKAAPPSLLSPARAPFYISKPDSMPTLSTPPLALHQLHEKGLQN